jgi:catecholate siderophore receptor
MKKQPSVLLPLKPIPAAIAAMTLCMNSAWAQTAQSDTSAGAAPAQVLAQAQPLPTVQVDATRINDDFTPDVSNVGSKTPTSLRDIPQSVTVINRAVLDSQGAASLADALRNVPGITIGGAEGGQIGNNIILRGFSANNTDLYLDGFRDRGQYYRDLFDLEQVEVLVGPSSMLFGRGSTGGVINQVTKQAGLANFSEVSGTVGTDGRLRATLDTDSKLSDTSALRVNAFTQDLQTTRDVMKNKDFGVAPTLRFGIGQPTEITVSALLQHNNDMPDYGVQSLNGSPITDTRDTDYGLGSDSTVQDIGMLNATIKHHFSDHLELRNQTQLNHYITDARESAAHALGTCTSGTATCVVSNSNITPLSGPPAFSGASYSLSDLYVELQSHDRNIIDGSLDNQTDLISRFQTGFIKHELVTGLEIGRDTYSNQALSRTGTSTNMPAGYVAWVPLINPGHSDPATYTTTVGNLAHASANTLGIYANDTLSFGEHWKAVTGVRWDRFDAQISNTMTSSTTPAQAYVNTAFTSVREGLLYQPTSEQSYYVSYGTSFIPLLAAMTSLNSQQAGLPPTTTQNYEMGGKWDLMNDRLSLAAAAFHEQEDNVYTQTSPGVYQAAGSWLIKGYTLSATGHVTEKLQMIAGYMHLDPKVVAATDGTQGSVPANTPKDTATLWTLYDITHAWQVGGGGNLISQRYVADTGRSATLPSGNIDLVSVPSYVRWDATAAYHQQHYEIRVNILNLTNKFYYDALVQSDGGRSVPGIGRTALLTASYKF